MGITKVFHDKVVYDRRMERLADILSGVIADDCSTILDVGCGDGQIDANIMSRKKGVVIHGIDVLERKKTMIPVQIYDGVNIPLEENSVDGVLLVDMLHHTDDPESVFSECLRVSKRYIIIKDHVLWGGISRIKLKVMDYVGNNHYGVRMPYNYLTNQQWESLFEKNSLIVEEYISNLYLYKGLFHLLFDGKLHFVARISKG